MSMMNWDKMIESISIFFLTCVLNIIFLLLFKKISFRFNLFKTKQGISYLGGVGIFLSFLIIYIGYSLFKKVTIPFQLAYLILFAFIMLAVEFFDDIKDFSLKTRIVIELILTYLFLIGAKRVQIYILPSWLNYIISFLWIMGMTHAFNHIDVGDGLCAGVAVIVSLSFLVISFICAEPLLINLFLILSAALLSFLLFNLPPAKMYLGNSGSHFLGFLFAGLAVYADYAGLENIPALFTPILVLAFPIIETVFLVVIRSKKGMLPMRKSNDHIYLRLLSFAKSPRKALGMLYLLTLFWCLAGIFVVLRIYIIFLITLAIAGLATAFVISKALSLR